MIVKDVLDMYLEGLIPYSEIMPRIELILECRPRRSWLVELIEQNYNAVDAITLIAVLPPPNKKVADTEGVVITIH